MNFITRLLVLLHTFVFASSAFAARSTELLSILKAGPGKPNQAAFSQAAQELQSLLRDPSARTPAVKMELLDLASSPDEAKQVAAFDALMQFTGDPDVRKVFVNALHSHPNPAMRGLMTGRIMVNTNRDQSVFPELRKALTDESEFVRVRAAQDLGRQGDYSGLGVLKSILSETPVRDPNPKLGSIDSDSRIAVAARAAGEILHPDLLPLLERLVALGKTAPQSSAEAKRSIWSIEMKLLSSREDKIHKLQAILQDTGGLYWIGRILVFRLDQLGVSKEDYLVVLKEAAASKDSRTAYDAKEAIRRCEMIERMKP